MPLDDFPCFKRCDRVCELRIVWNSLVCTDGLTGSFSSVTFKGNNFYLCLSQQKQTNPPLDGFKVLKLNINWIFK